MRRLMRQPLAWMILVEVAVVAALIGVAWHVVEGGAQGAAPALVLGATPVPEDTAPPSEAPGILFPPSPTGKQLLPGLNVDPAFWRERLAGLNAAEAQVEALEWRIVHSAMDTVQRYVDSVLVPAVEKAERGGR